jgi:hypothetical protein
MGKTRAQRPQASLTLDTGALIALDRGDGRMIALLQELRKRSGLARVPAGVVGQAWRNGARQALLARFLRSSHAEIVALDGALARACGELCSAAGTTDVIDASVVLVARQHADVIVTSDVADMRALDPSASLERI